MSTVGEIVAILDRMFPPRLAEEWDAPGLSVGDPSATVTRVHFAVDPVRVVIDEAVAAGAEMLVTHHPLLLRGVTSVAANTGKGSAVHRLISGGCALYSAHTNADSAADGVADALAAAIGVAGLRPLVPDARGSLARNRARRDARVGDDAARLRRERGRRAAPDRTRRARRGGPRHARAHRRRPRRIRGLVLRRRPPRRRRRVRHRRPAPPPGLGGPRGRAISRTAAPPSST